MTPNPGVTYTSQVTAGVTYRYYDVPLVMTTCSTDVCDSASLSGCEVHSTGKTKTCDFQVQHRAWADESFEVETRGLQACLTLRD